MQSEIQFQQSGSEMQMFVPPPGTFLQTQTSLKASEKQVGGDHYKTPGLPDLAWFCHQHKLPFLEASAMKYLFRHRRKGGAQDLDKAIHYIELLKQYEYGDDDATQRS
jgi:hypothetical protein